MTNALAFNGVSLSPISQNNQLWIKSKELAQALGYSREDSVNKIFERNEDEFTENMTQVIEILDNVNLTFTENLTNKARIFSLRGCHLVAMFARTKIAKEFRKWVLDVLENQLSGNSGQLPLTPSTKDDRKQLSQLVQVWMKKSHTRHTDCWAQINAHFRIAKIAELPVEWLPDAIDFVQSRIDTSQLALENHQAALPAGQEIPTQNNCPFAPVAFTEAEIKVKKHLIDRLERVLCILQEDQMFYKLWARMGVRILGLPKEKQLLYEAGEAHMDAFRGHMYLAQRSLKSALEIEVNVKFD